MCIVCTETVSFIPPFTMASYDHFLQETRPRFDSPAKIFAKLKSKVQREGTCSNEGDFTRKDPLCNVREKHGADFKSPRKRRERTRMNGELEENKRLDYCNEAQALTLSPISSPRKTFGYLDISCSPAEEVSPMSQPLYSTWIHTIPPQIGDLDGFNVTNRTPVKMLPVETECVSDDVFSPTKKRKRNWEPRGFNEVRSQHHGRRGPFSENDIHVTCMEDLIHVRGLSEPNPLPHEPMFPPPGSPTMKRCSVYMEKLAPMSPAKMFAYMKERESKTGQPEVQNINRSSMRNLFDKGSFHPSRDKPPSTAHNMDENEDAAFTTAPKNVVPARVASSDSESDTHPSEDVPIPASPPQPVLLKDPLILNTPRISIPKKNQAEFTRNKWHQPAKFPSESVIHLKKWVLKGNHEVFVEGIHCEKNIPWSSSIIVNRVTNYVVKTVSGRVYILVGKMNLHVDSVFPKWLLKKFANGFPPDWKALYEKFLSELRDRDAERNSEASDTGAKKTSDPSSISLSVKQRRKKPLKTPETCPPPSSSAAKVSRSGRIIKPPLEYWKGGRVVLDAFMNVTVHECYETSICIPKVPTIVSARVSRNPARVFLPYSERCKQGESARDKEASAPLRKVKAPPNRRNRTRVTSNEKPSLSPEPPAETRNSPEEWSGRTRSRQRCPVAERPLHVDSLPQKQHKLEKPATQRTKKQTHDSTRPSVKASRSKQAHSASLKSPTACDKTAKDQSSNDDFYIRKPRRGKGAQGRRGEESQPSHSSEESEKEQRKARKKRDVAQTKRNERKCTKTSQPAMPLPASTQSSRAHKGKPLIPQEQDEDEWTEAELIRLKEAVASYPKHIGGYWAKVARIVGTRSAEECYNQHTSQGTSQTPAKKPKKKKVEARKDSGHPVISARVGTLKRKQQVRDFLENMPREDVDDVFSSVYMQNKRFEMPSMCPSDDHDFALSDLEPVTPKSTGFPEAKTPQCLYITPGMMGSPNRSKDDKYVFQLQKRMKKNQFNVCKKAPSNNITATPSVKRTMTRYVNTGNDTFVIREMFQGNDGALSESEEEDFYFSDND